MPLWLIVALLVAAIAVSPLLIWLTIGVLYYVVSWLEQREPLSKGAEKMPIDLPDLPVVPPVPVLPPIPVKPGSQTSEFWATAAIAVVNVITLMVTLRLVPLADAENLTQLATGLVAALGVVVGNAVGLVSYIKSRTSVKVEAMKR